MQVVDEGARQPLPGFQPRLGGQAAQAALDVEERVDALDGLQRDRGDLVGGLPLRTLPAMSASSKNLRRAWLQHSALVTGPGARSVR